MRPHSPPTPVAPHSSRPPVHPIRPPLQSSVLTTSIPAVSVSVDGYLPAYLDVHSLLFQFLEECGGSGFTAGTASNAADLSAYHPTSHDLLEFVRQCQIADSSQVFSVLIANATHYFHSQGKAIYELYCISWNT